ncbi:PTS mannose/fructose/sorbose transporter subunit IIB [bacterium]|nr:MAG: PTS mannose/fructose/sorbose transporter subunit IIB [bacterium]
MLTLVRIDDRLIHGQVVEGWLPVLKAQRVAVVCDQAASDPTTRALMELSVPPAVALDVLTVAAAPSILKNAAASPERVLVLAPGPQEVLALHEAGVPFSSVNVGGLHYAAGTVQLGRAIYLDSADIDCLEALDGRGVRVEGRAVPSEAPLDVMAALKARA